MHIPTPWLAGAALFMSAAVASTGPAPRFEAQTLDDQVQIGYGLAVGDVDGDGRPDILLADKKQFVWYRNGDWRRFVMADGLTEHDNVAIAAEDIDGDGRVEVAVGAQWNPGETTDPAESGSVHYLIRPEDPTGLWDAVRLPHEPTVHRMRWVRTGAGGYSLVVLPLHGRGNRNGQGAGVRVLAYERPADPREPWAVTVLDSTMHMTHNLDVLTAPEAESSRLFVGGREGIHVITHEGGRWRPAQPLPTPGHGGIGEVRVGYAGGAPTYLAAIEPMHGSRLAVYPLGGDPVRYLLDSTLAEGHALATGDLLGLGYDQVVAGWRRPDVQGKVGVRLYVPDDREPGGAWTQHVIDDNTMAAEDLKLADLDGDGLLDVIAAGRATNNLVVYWNRTGSRP